MPKVDFNHLVFQTVVPGKENTTLVLHGDSQMKCKMMALNVSKIGTGIVLTIGLNNVYGQQVQKLVDGFNQQKTYEIAEIKKKRSLDSNSFCWKLCTEIANVVGNTKEDVYRDAISHVGVYEVLQFTDADAMARFKQKWMANGEGWLTKTIDKDKMTIMAFYGSSRYDTKEMSVLIDFLVQEGKDLGIQVLTEEQIELMKTEWR